MFRLAAALSAGVAVTGCATLNLGSNHRCGTNENRTWKPQRTPPDADTFRKIALANRVWGGRLQGKERWFGSEQRVMLCRVKLYEGGGTGEWWIFDTTTSPPTLEEADGWLDVT
jgi:hypothetical protein